MDGIYYMTSDVKWYLIVDIEEDDPFDVNLKFVFKTLAEAQDKLKEMYKNLKEYEKCINYNPDFGILYYDSYMLSSYELLEENLKPMKFRYRIMLVKPIDFD